MVQSSQPCSSRLATMTEARVTVTVEGSVAIVRLNRPDKHNGVDIPMIQALIATARQLKKNRDIRAVILTGEGPSF